MVLLQRKLYFSKDPEGVQNFPGGGGLTFSLCLFLKKPIELVIFQGIPTPFPPSGSAHA